MPTAPPRRSSVRQLRHAVGSHALDRRSAGILLHVTSLPGPHGAGDLGPSAHRFVDWLADAGQTWWQMLPIGPVGAGNSPYSSSSAFAGNPLLISLDALVADGLLHKADAAGAPPGSAERIGFPALVRYRQRALRSAFAAFEAHPRRWRAEFDAFCARHASWLEDFALFCAGRALHRGRPWNRWERQLCRRRTAALRELRESAIGQYSFARFVQFVFDRQWNQLRQHARRARVGLIGDLPIFVSHDSADVWSHQHLFLLGRDGRPTFVSGVPPDLFSRTGQLWGHPLYAWRQHRAEGFTWWIERFRRAFERFDALRVDHFLGFSRCWAVRGGSRTAMTGAWRASPGYELFGAVTEALGGLPVIAEDLGLLTPSAARLRDAFGFQGIRLLQAGLAGTGDYHRPHGFIRGCAAYTGTHDNDTSVGWFDSLSARRVDGLSPRERVLEYVGTDRAGLAWGLLRLLYASVANTVIVPMQDVLGLGSEARMNTPATIGGNWTWRMASWSAARQRTSKLRELAVLFDRHRAE